MIKKLLSLLLFFALIACGDEPKPVSDTTWIGGQIVNPKMEYVIFAKGDEVLDTIHLDSNNFFLHQIKKVKSGIYSFRHGENQMFYLEPGDSLLIHVNTMDFDESLSYSGRGGDKNNLLMDLFLTNEKENSSLNKLYSLQPEAFRKKVDSLKQLKLKDYNDFIENNEVSEGYKEVALASINYFNYSQKELYLTANFKKLKAFPDSFFDYKKDINFNNSNLKSYYPYYRFLNRYFENLAFARYEDIQNVNRNSFDYNYKKLLIIDSLVSNDTLKNNLLRDNTLRYLVNGKTAEEEERMASMFYKMNSNLEHKAQVEKFVQATVNLTAGNIIPNVMLVNTDNVVMNLHEVITKPTVLYFWTAQSVQHFKDIHVRAMELKSKFPEYNFIGINTDTHFKKWRKTIEKTQYNPKTEFQLENLADAEKKLVLNSINKAIILDKKSTILESNSNLFNKNFEELLLGYLNSNPVSN